MYNWETGAQVGWWQHIGDWDLDEGLSASQEPKKRFQLPEEPGDGPRKCAQEETCKRKKEAACFGREAEGTKKKMRGGN